MLQAHWLPILTISAAVVVGKVISCGFGAFVGGNDTRTSLRVGMGLAQIGEFSFIIASLGMTLKVTRSFLYPIAVAVSAITTLLTPYLIRSADGLVAQFDRAAPPSLIRALGIYTSWTGRISRRTPSLATRLMRRWLAQIALNAALIAAVFIAAAFVGQHPPQAVLQIGLTDEWMKAALWLTAVIVSLPMFIATSRKLQAIGLLVAESKVTKAAAGPSTASIQALVAQGIPMAGVVILAVFVLLLSSALLPTFKVFILLLILAALISWNLRRAFVRLYSKAQLALEETFAQSPPATHPEPPRPMPPQLRDAHLETVTLAPDSWVAGRLIHEIQLRTETGASIVGMERAGTNMVNPGPNEELQAGDQILLLGSRGQLDAAVALLARRPED